MAAVGRIVRPHGIRGHVVINPETDFPEERFRPGSELFTRTDGEVRRLRVSDVRFHRGRPIVALEGIDSISAAEPLVGVDLRVPVEQLAKLPSGTFYRHDLVGSHVETADGQPVGVVTDVEGTLTGSRLVVRAEDGGEVLIPLVAAICVAIDPVQKRIVVEPPAGLLEANR
jgi:16S rRNA processing protein RimM